MKPAPEPDAGWCELRDLAGDLARALHREPDLLLPDEATSGLDEATETRLLSGPRQMHPRMSVVYITHRASNLVFADTVYRLEDGMIADVSVRT